MYVLRNIMRVLELGRTNMTGRCRAPILKPSLFALTALRFCLPSPKTLASVLHSQGFSFSSSLLQWPLFFSDTPLPLLAASSPQPLKSTLPYLVLLSLLPVTPPPPPSILSIPIHGGDPWQLSPERNTLAFSFSSQNLKYTSNNNRYQYVFYLFCSSQCLTLQEPSR